MSAGLDLYNEIREAVAKLCARLPTRKQQSIAFMRTAQIPPEIDRADGQLRDMRNSAKCSRRPVSRVDKITLLRKAFDISLSGSTAASASAACRLRVVAKAATRLRSCACSALYSRRSGWGQSPGWFRSAPIATDEWITALYRRLDGTWRCDLTTCTALPMCAN